MNYKSVGIGNDITYSEANNCENRGKAHILDRLCYLFLIFLVGCLVGWIYEEIFYWITGDCILSALFRTPITY